MKRYYLFAIAMFSVLLVHAETNIQNTFFGCTLGKSTSTEVQSAMLSQGIEFVQNDTTKMEGIYICRYSGNTEWEGGVFNSIVTAFIEDTLSIMIMSSDDEFPYSQVKVQSNLESKYGKYKPADDLLPFISLINTELPSDTKNWSRYDDSTIVLTLSYANYFNCWHINMHANYGSILLITRLLAQNYSNEFFANYCTRNKVYGVAGVKFGDNRESVSQIIASKSDRLSSSDSHSLTYYKTHIGGTTYDFTTFYFVQGKGLVAASFQKPFYSWQKEEATMAYEDIVAQYKRKYSNLKVGEDGEENKYCTCGAHTDDYDYHPIFIGLQKAVSEGGRTMYYVAVSYYVIRIQGLYDDEI